MQIDKENPGFRLALELINTTDQHIFIGGKAGTGKTTFLKILQGNTSKKIAITASTGVAAINAGGVTLHSLFNFPLVAYLPENLEKYADRRLDASSRKVLDELDVLVIDEASMLRADTLDAIDYRLRNVRKEKDSPFGGVQLILIGDLLQLPPVLLPNEKSLFLKYYESEFFIDSKSFISSNPIFIELEKPYRQSDPVFLDILNALRDNQLTSEMLENLNQHCTSGTDLENRSTINLTTHNEIADLLNAENFLKLHGESQIYSAKITGNYDEKDFPTERELTLKVGAKVMLLKNDKSKLKKYFNGKIGTIESLDASKIIVRFGQNELLELEEETWTNSAYKFDINTSSFRQEELGTFQQIPVRLAWAITIHKSQGLTFDRAIVDVQRAFASGQVYVALSRLKSLEGLILKAPVSISTIITHPRAKGYLSNSPNIINGQMMKTYQQSFFKRKMLNFFKLADYEHLKFLDFDDKEFEVWKKTLSEIRFTISKFINQFQSLFPLIDDNTDQVIDRVTKAFVYFQDQYSQFLKVLEQYQVAHKNDFNYSRKIVAVKEVQKYIRKRVEDWRSVDFIIGGLINGKNIPEILFALSERKEKEVEKKSTISLKVIDDKKSPEQISLQLFKAGNSLANIGKICGLSTDTIENHLTLFLKTGEIDILELVSQDDLEKIQNACLTGIRSLFELKKLTGNKYSLGQIKAVITYFDLQKLHK